MKQDLQKALTTLFTKHNKQFDDEIKDDLPRKWEKHGDFILFPETSFTLDIWSSFDQKELWKCVAESFHVNRIAKQAAIINNDYRSPNITMLHGKDTEVIHVDNKIKYQFHVTKCMFSSGNITEKIRIAKLDCHDEVVVDMFAGIGYFSLPFLVHAKAKHLHACEWNPDAVKALKKNLVLNKVSDRCSVYEGDNRVVCPVGIADRVNLGLIPTAEASYYTAGKALNKEVGGILHVHGNVSSGKDYVSCRSSSQHLHQSTCIKSFNTTCNRTLKQSWLDWGVGTAEIFLDILQTISQNLIWTMTVVHIERVKSYGPHVDHLVVDLDCRISKKVER